MSHEKICVFCPHFQYAAPEYTYYSTLTGGDLSGGLSCGKGHFSEYDECKDEDSFRALILRAETCLDYGGPA